MRVLATYLFYLFSVVVILFELLKIGGLDLSRLVVSMANKAAKEQEENKQATEEGKDTSFAQQGAFLFVYVIMVSFMLLYVLWNLVGLFSSQWIFFLVLLILAIVTGSITHFLKGYAPKLVRAVVYSYALITVILLVAMILNRFHFHVDILQIFKGSN